MGNDMAGSLLSHGHSLTHPWRDSSRTPTHFRQTLSELLTPVSVHIAYSVSTRIPALPSHFRPCNTHPRSSHAQMRHTGHSDFRRSASTTHWSSRRIRWRNAFHASTHGCRHTTHIQISPVGRATPPCSILLLCCIPPPNVLVPQRSMRSHPRHSGQSRGPVRSRAPRHCSTEYHLASLSSRRDAC